MNYIKFWLAKALVDLGTTVAIVVFVGIIWLVLYLYTERKKTP